MTAVDERAVLDVDLEQDVPCRWDSCHRPATWRLTLVHVLGGACTSDTLCDPHRRRLDREVRRATRAARKRGGLVAPMCRTHGTTITLNWRPL